jgi:hypothetical protein
LNINQTKRLSIHTKQQKRRNDKKAKKKEIDLSVPYLEIIHELDIENKREGKTKIAIPVDSFFAFSDIHQLEL